MSNYSVADAKNSLPRLIHDALRGEEVIITRRGEPVVELRPIASRPSPSIATHAWLQARRQKRKSVGLTSVQILDQLYDSDER